MPNVENNETEVVEEVKVLNPLDRYKYTEDEFAAYLKDNAIPGEDPVTRPKIVDYQKDMDKPGVLSFKALVFAWKNAGKTHLIRTMPELNLQCKEINKLENSHVKWLLKNKMLMPITQGEGLDSEGKGDVAREKFAGIAFRNRPMFYEDGPMPLMQNPVAYMREWALWMKAIQWAFSHPDIYKSKTGLNAPDAAAFENLTIFGNEIMDYVRTISHDKKADKLAAKGQELGAPLEPKFDNYDIRNRNWDYAGGFTQNKFEPHLLVTCRARKKWVNSEPTDTDDIAVYSQASAAYNIVVFLWREDNEETRTRKFFGQIVSSDWMEPGTMYPVIENPTWLKIAAVITMYSHRRILDKNGTWKKYKYKNGTEFEAWVENKKEGSVTIAKSIVKGTMANGQPIIGVGETKFVNVGEVKLGQETAVTVTPQPDGKVSVEIKPVAKPTPAVEKKKRVSKKKETEVKEPEKKVEPIISADVVGKESAKPEEKIEEIEE
jgi:hypothetical protein